jgi:hypothetical protein
LNFVLTFIGRKTQEEKTAIEGPSDDQEDNNQPFTIQELNAALETCKVSSPRPDEVHYEMLKNLPITANYALLPHIIGSGRRKVSQTSEQRLLQSQFSRLVRTPEVLRAIAL